MNVVIEIKYEHGNTGIILFFHTLGISICLEVLVIDFLLGLSD